MVGGRDGGQAPQPEGARVSARASSRSPCPACGAHALGQQILVGLLPLQRQQAIVLEHDDGLFGDAVGVIIVGAGVSGSFIADRLTAAQVPGARFEQPLALGEPAAAVEA